jgi:phosphoglycerol transferase
MDLRDFPLGSDNLHWLLIKGIGLLSGDAVVVTNLYYFASFALVALSAFFVARALGTSRRAGFVVAMLYTFLPYHFLRGTGHLQLAAYFSVPIACLLVVRVWTDDPPFFRRVDGRMRLEWKEWRTLWYVVGALVIASSGLYYAAFCLTLLVAVALLRLAVGRNWTTGASALLLCAVIGGGVLVNTAPSILYRLEHGRNTEVIDRTVQESDIYALRPIQLLSPTPGHRVEQLDQIAAEVLSARNYSDATPFLGLVGAAGFLGLMILLLGLGGRTRRGERAPPLLLRLAALTALATLIGVTGGLSWIIGLAGLTEIRAWNRISVFIAFFALLAVAIWLDRFVAWLPRFRWKALAVSAGTLLLVALAVLDQTNSFIIPDSRVFAAEWDSDDDFVQAIERRLGPGDAVFQLPYLPFPEGALDLPPYGMEDYDPFRGYLHSDDLRWSYGAMRGREGDWQAQVVELGTKEMLDAVAAVGFRGLWVDRLGYPEEGAAVEDDLRDLLGEAPIVSPDERFVFFDLRPWAAELGDRLGTDGVRALRAETLRNVG